MHLVKGVLRVDSGRQGCHYLITRPRHKAPSRAPLVQNAICFYFDQSKERSIKGCLGRSGEMFIFL